MRWYYIYGGVDPLTYLGIPSSGHISRHFLLHPIKHGCFMPRPGGSGCHCCGSSCWCFLGHQKSGCGILPGCHTPTMTGDGFLGTHNTGDDLGLILVMVYGIGVCHFNVQQAVNVLFFLNCRMSSRLAVALRDTGLTDWFHPNSIDGEGHCWISFVNRYPFWRCCMWIPSGKLT